MDSFVKRTGPTGPSPAAKIAPKKRKEQSDFLTVASRKFEKSNADVGVDIIGDLKDNLDNVVDYFKLVNEFDNIKGEIQQFQFTAPFPTKEYRLIELTPSLLEAFERGDSFAFRGDADENAVMCTATRTYDVKETETSNTMMLTPKQSTADQVCVGVPTLTVREVPCMKQHYLELKELLFVSKIKLRETLKANELRDWLTDARERKWTLDVLLDTIQISEGELLGTLKDWPVVLIEGSYRWLSIDLRRELLDGAVEAIDDQCLAADRSIGLEHLRTALPDKTRYPDVLLEWVLHTHFNVVERTDGATGPLQYLAAHRPFCRTRARQILPLVKHYPLADFEQRLEKMVPIGVVLKMEYLDGLALRTKSLTQGERIEYFSADDLPEGPRERLGLLFTTRTPWRLEEIAPYVAPILPRGTLVQSFLHQHCRAETSSKGDKSYVALKPL
ncbi:hypothetical protein PFISCL1PPCAC_22656 [Pristionchus fissidentatus]|uniref:Sister chromatid cohesion protein DCC1 n=1 Tax=Pristionchus fissidentatus TaxID=1538716 RepID=A0AAV5WNN1_9BILA|nr:hypothetical protein PFISCL1PPCAC_22656 [Pristionchus fissidentatus]